MCSCACSSACASRFQSSSCPSHARIVGRHTWLTTLLVPVVVRSRVSSLRLVRSKLLFLCVLPLLVVPCQLASDAPDYLFLDSWSLPRFLSHALLAPLPGPLPVIPVSLLPFQSVISSVGVRPHPFRPHPFVVEGFFDASGLLLSACFTCPVPPSLPRPVQSWNFAIPPVSAAQSSSMFLILGSAPKLLDSVAPRFHPRRLAPAFASASAPASASASASASDAAPARAAFVVPAPVVSSASAPVAVVVVVAPAPAPRRDPPQLVRSPALPWPRQVPTKGTAPTHSYYLIESGEVACSIHASVMKIGLQCQLPSSCVHSPAAYPDVASLYDSSSAITALSHYLIELSRKVPSTHASSINDGLQCGSLSCAHAPDPADVDVPTLPDMPPAPTPILLGAFGVCANYCIPGVKGMLRVPGPCEGHSQAACAVGLCPPDTSAAVVRFASPTQEKGDAPGMCTSSTSYRICPLTSRGNPPGPTSITVLVDHPHYSPLMLCPNNLQEPGKPRGLPVFASCTPVPRPVRPRISLELRRQ